MTTTEWDGTPWAGTVVATGSWANGLAAKAAVGWEPIYNPANIPISSLNRSPLKRMRGEQALYWSHPWIKTAEDAVTRRVAGLPWHIETEDEEEVEDQTPDPRLKLIRTLLEKPQAALRIEERQVGLETWTNLETITSRHLGICGMTHWYLDSVDNDGLPKSIMYVNPARLYPVTTSTGQLLAWRLDPKDDDGNGGLVLERNEILTFYLQPPDWGAISTGLVYAAEQKARITTSADMHLNYTLTSGGQRGGFISPKSGTMDDEQYKILTQELRSAADMDPRERRKRVIRGPIEFHDDTMTPEQLDEVAIAAMGRDDILTIWGVPQSQAPVATAAGLNSGDTKKFDEAVLYQGAVHDRIRAIKETIQLGLLDRWNAVGLNPQLVVEEPSFDDRTPAFALAATAKDQPLTRNERRELMGLAPLPEYGPDAEPLGLAIDLPLVLQVVGQGEEDERTQPEGRFNKAPQKPTPEPSVFPNPIPQIPAVLPAKADTLRGTVARRFEPAIRKAVTAFLRAQRAEIAAKVREKGEHLAQKPNDWRAWWDGERWNKRLEDALKGTVAGIGTNVATKVQTQFGPAKADPFTDSVIAALLRKVGIRIRGINDTTRDDISRIIGDAFDKGLSPGEAAALIEDATAFNEARAELIARTETALVYNEAALTSYTEFGVEMVEAIDGDDDDECRDRVANNPYTLEEAMAIEDHPNGTLDWVPILAAKAPAVEQHDWNRTNVQIMLPDSIEVPANPAPIVNYAPPNIDVAAPIVHIPAFDMTPFVEALREVHARLDAPIRREVIRDPATGAITGTVEVRG